MTTVGLTLEPWQRRYLEQLIADGDHLGAQRFILDELDHPTSTLSRAQIVSRYGWVAVCPPPAPRPYRRRWCPSWWPRSWWWPRRLIPLESRMANHPSMG